MQAIYVGVALGAPFCESVNEALYFEVLCSVFRSVPLSKLEVMAVPKLGNSVESNSVSAADCTHSPYLGAIHCRAFVCTNFIGTAKLKKQRTESVMSFVTSLQLLAREAMGSEVASLSLTS